MMRDKNLFLVCPKFLQNEQQFNQNDPKKALDETNNEVSGNPQHPSTHPFQYHSKIKEKKVVGVKGNNSALMEVRMISAVHTERI